MKLRTVHVPSPFGPEQTRDQVGYILGTLGWEGSWVDPWSGLAHQGSEGASVIAGPFAGFCEVHWAVHVAPTGESVVTVAQVRNSWVGKGGIVDGKRAGKRLDELVATLQTLWPAPEPSSSAPASPHP